MKFCKDCKFFPKDSHQEDILTASQRTEWSCQHEKALIVSEDMVTGERTEQRLNCSTQRYANRPMNTVDRYCGPDATWFEPVSV